MQQLLSQLRQKANEAEYGIVTDYDQQVAFALARLQEIEEKRELNFEYPNNCIEFEDLNHIIIKNS